MPPSAPGNLVSSRLQARVLLLARPGRLQRQTGSPRLRPPLEVWLDAQAYLVAAPSYLVPGCGGSGCLGFPAPAPSSLDTWLLRGRGYHCRDAGSSRRRRSPCRGRRSWRISGRAIVCGADVSGGSRWHLRRYTPYDRYSIQAREHAPHLPDHALPPG